MSTTRQSSWDSQEQSQHDMGHSAAGGGGTGTSTGIAFGIFKRRPSHPDPNNDHNNQFNSPAAAAVRRPSFRLNSTPLATLQRQQEQQHLPNPPLHSSSASATPLHTTTGAGYETPNITMNMNTSQVQQTGESEGLIDRSVKITMPKQLPTSANSPYRAPGTAGASTHALTEPELRQKAEVYGEVINVSTVVVLYLFVIAC